MLTNPYKKGDTVKIYGWGTVNHESDNPEETGDYNALFDGEKAKIISVDGLLCLCELTDGTGLVDMHFRQVETDSNNTLQ